LSFTSKDDVYKDTFPCKSDESISEKLNIQAISMEISSSTKYGTLKFLNDGRFTYTPSKGFKGSDSFVVKAMVSGSETVYYTVNIKVEG
jgi:hypothetical protein